MHGVAYLPLAVLLPMKDAWLISIGSIGDGLYIGPYISWSTNAACQVVALRQLAYHQLKQLPIAQLPYPAGVQRVLYFAWEIETMLRALRAKVER